MAKEGKISDAYSSAARISVPPTTASSGRRLILFGRLFTRASVLLVSIRHLPHPRRFIPRLGEEAPEGQQEPGDADQRQDEEPQEARVEDEQAQPEAGQEPQCPPRPPLAPAEGDEDDDEGQDLETHPAYPPRPHHGVRG